jgi:hypothetical protein
VPAVKDREDLPGMPANKSFVGRLIQLRLAELHPIFFAEAFNLSVAKHRQSRQGG